MLHFRLTLSGSQGEALYRRLGLARQGGDHRPAIVALAQEQNAYVLLGDEGSFPQWGTLSYTLGTARAAADGENLWPAHGLQGVWPD
jgi:hypothetical protein